MATEQASFIHIIQYDVFRQWVYLEFSVERQPGHDEDVTVGLVVFLLRFGGNNLKSTLISKLTPHHFKIMYLEQKKEQNRRRILLT